MSNQEYALLAQLDRVTGYEPVGQGFESLAARQKKALAKASAFFNEINPCGICEMRFAREIRLRRVKCLRA